MNFKHILISALSLILLVSCQKEIEVPTDLYIYTQIQALKTDYVTNTDSFKGYILFADTADYEVTSFADAEQGIFTDKLTGEKVSFDAEAVYDYELEALVLEQITTTNNILLVVDSANEVYAYKYQATANGLPLVQISFILYLWNFSEETLQFDSNKWTFVIDEYIADETDTDTDTDTDDTNLEDTDETNTENAE